MSQERKARLAQAEQERREHQSKADELGREIHQLRLDDVREEYPCTCVKLNSDIEIFDMAEQARRNRNCLAVTGMVAECLTARKDCEWCSGTGKPHKHNHFGEIHVPATCPACRVKS